MLKKLLAPLVLFIALLGMPQDSYGQDKGISKKKQEKTLAKEAKKQKKAKKKQDRHDRKRHLSLQDKAARKRIKRHNKRADRSGSNTHRDGFFRRTFGL